jgi:hypothetical protein
MRNFAQCSEILATAKNKGAGKPIANNTRLFDRGDYYAIQLHATDILKIYPDDSVVYDSGGWKTVTTKARMNDYGPLPVTSNRGTWYCGRHVYRDGMRVFKDGTAENAGRESDEILERKERLAVAKYAKAYVAALYNYEIPTPTNGDCWGCLMKAKDGTRPMGGADHIRQHITDGYFVPSLVWNAAEDFGVSIMAKNDIAGLQGAPGRPDNWRAFGLQDQIGRAIRRHCLRELGYSA